MELVISLHPTKMFEDNKKAFAKRFISCSFHFHYIEHLVNNLASGSAWCSCSVSHICFYFLRFSLNRNQKKVQWEHFRSQAKAGWQSVNSFTIDKSFRGILKRNFWQKWEGNKSHNSSGSENNKKMKWNEMYLSHWIYCRLTSTST